MTALLLAVIPIVLTALFAGHVAVSRTGRLRKDILANLDLLGRLPAEHPNRAVLEAKNRELVGVLARRQQRRYGPFTQAGFSPRRLRRRRRRVIGVRLLRRAAGHWGHPLDLGLGRAGPWRRMGRGGVLPGHSGGCTVAAGRAVRRQLREHLEPAQQPTEAG